ncbi:hypothetical protein DFP74_5777 [Nocardiopsis sp. Huas11]|uniref:hypothetical protein n=1 Tax=Nocardiopsis sp. Huas11 TaxID=2183912 RepID=UPI000EB101B8|nr:hypothetical protein [Nocardiopsis sp. Huas11]RKS10031.1 hypothetical protein DFP74_5777 [Nocardiopsis sp. Huas11]
MTLEELPRQTAPRTSRDRGLRPGPLPRRSRLDFYFIAEDLVTDTQGEPLTGVELAGLADRFDDHTIAPPGASPALPVTVEFFHDLVHAGGRALAGGEVAALSVHVRSLTCTEVAP